MGGGAIKVAFVCSSPYLHGAGRILINMAKRLQDDHQIEPHVFAYGGGGTREFQSVAGQTVLHFHSLTNDLPWYMFLHDDAFSISDHIGQVMRSTDELVTDFRDLGINCVIVNTLTSLPGMLAAAKLKVPSILWLHAIVDHMLLPQSGDRFKSACDRIMLFSANFVVCPSHWVKDHFKFFREDIHVIPNFTFVPDKPSEYPSGTTRFSCLNAWEPNKDLECLIEAADILSKKKLNFVLNLYGWGPLKEKMYSMIQEKHLDKVVYLHERVVDIGNIYANTHALVTASLIEAFGMTLIEAMAHARPIIVSETSGHKEILQDSKFGFFCEVANPASFAEKMEWVIQHPEESREMGLAGYDVALRLYDGRESARSMFNLVKTAVDDGYIVSSRQLHNYFICDVMQDLLKPFVPFSARGFTNMLYNFRKLYKLGMEYIAIYGFRRFVIAAFRYVFSLVRRKIF